MKNRATAFKVPLQEIVSGEFFPSTKQFEPSYLKTKNGLKISRANVWGNIVQKYVSGEKPFASIVLDDFTECISVNAFEENSEKLTKFEVGERVEVIGKIKENNYGLFIVLENIKKVSETEELLKRTENLFCLKELTKNKAKQESEIKEVKVKKEFF